MSNNLVQQVPEAVEQLKGAVLADLNLVTAACVGRSRLGPATQDLVAAHAERAAFNANSIAILARRFGGGDAKASV